MLDHQVGIAARPDGHAPGSAVAWGGWAGSVGEIRPDPPEAGLPKSRRDLFEDVFIVGRTHNGPAMVPSDRAPRLGSHLCRQRSNSVKSALSRHGLLPQVARSDLANRTVAVPVNITKITVTGSLGCAKRFLTS